MNLKATFALGALLVVCSSRAGLFSGGAVFFVAPQSQMGIVSNGLTITNTPTGFTVSGTVTVLTTPGADSGTLLTFDVRRPLNSAFGTGTFNTTTTVIGTSTPPTGAFGNTSGYTQSFFNTYGISTSQVNLTLTAGVGSWAASNSSPSFGYNSLPPGQWVEQYFQLDGVQFTGPGGLWTISIPTTTVVNDMRATPEPAPVLALGLGVAGLIVRRRRPR
jgi:hypothetical protein